jgi:hypothetical protein
MEDNVLKSDTSAFPVDYCALLAMLSKCPEISALFPLVSRLIREGTPKIPDIPAFSTWFQHLLDKSTNKDLIFQASYKTETIHASKSDSYIKLLLMSVL